MQDLLAILIALCAAAFLARRAWQRVTRRSTSGCGSCATCPTATAGASKQQLVTLESHSFSREA